MVDTLAHLWEPLGWQPDRRQREQFAQLQGELALWNRRLNQIGRAHV